MRARRELDRLILRVALAVHPKGSSVKWAAVIRRRHGSCGVESASTQLCLSCRSQRLAIRGSSGVVEDVKTQNVRRPVGEGRRVRAEDVSRRIKSNNACLQLAGFWVDGHGHARGIVAWSESAVSGIVRLQAVGTSWQKGGLEGCSAGAKGCSSYASVHSGRSREGNVAGWCSGCCRSDCG